MIKVKNITIRGTTEQLLKLKDQLIFTLKENRRQTEWAYEDVDIEIVNNDISKDRE